MNGVISTVVSPCGQYRVTWHDSGSTMVVPLFHDIDGRQDYALTHPIEPGDMFVPVNPQTAYAWIPLPIAAATDPFVSTNLLKDFAEFLEG